MTDRLPPPEGEAPPAAIEAVLPVAGHVAQRDFNELLAQAKQFTSSSPADVCDTLLKQDTLPQVTVRTGTKPDADPPHPSGSPETCKPEPSVVEALAAVSDAVKQVVASVGGKRPEPSSNSPSDQSLLPGDAPLPKATSSHNAPKEEKSDNEKDKGETCPTASGSPPKEAVATANQVIEAVTGLQNFLPAAKPVERTSGNPVSSSPDKEQTGPVASGFPLAQIVSTVVASSTIAVKEAIKESKEFGTTNGTGHGGTSSGSPDNTQAEAGGHAGTNGSWFGDLTRKISPTPAPASPPEGGSLPAAKPAEPKIQATTSSGDIFTNAMTQVTNSIQQAYNWVAEVKTPTVTHPSTTSPTPEPTGLQQLVKPSATTNGTDFSLPAATAAGNIDKMIPGVGAPVPSPEAKLPVVIPIQPSALSDAAAVLVNTANTVSNVIKQTQEVVQNGFRSEPSTALPISLASLLRPESGSATIIPNIISNPTPVENRLPSAITIASPSASQMENHLLNAITIASASPSPVENHPSPITIAIATNAIENRALPTAIIAAPLAGAIENRLPAVIASVENRLPTVISPIVETRPSGGAPIDSRPLQALFDPSAAHAPAVSININRDLPTLISREPISLSLAKAEAPAALRELAIAAVPSSRLDTKIDPRVDLKVDAPRVESLIPGRAVTVDLTSRNEAAIRETTMRGIAAVIDANGRVIGENISIRFQLGDKKGDNIVIGEGAVKITAGQPIVLTNGVIIIKTKGERGEGEQLDQDGDATLSTSANGIRVNPILVNGSSVPTNPSQDPNAITGSGMPGNVDPNQVGVTLPTVQIVVDPDGNQIIIIGPNLTPAGNAPQVAQADEGLVVATAGGWMIVPNGMLLNDWTIVTPTGDQWVPNSDGHYVPNTQPTQVTIEPQPEPPRESNAEKEARDADRRRRMEEENRRQQEEAKAARERAERIRRDLEEKQRRIQEALLAEIATKKTQVMIENEIRRKYIVKDGDTLESIAEQQLKDVDLALLIFKVNKLTIKTQVENGKRVPQVRAGMVLYLPNMTDIVIFRESLDCDIAGGANTASRAAKDAAWERLFGALGKEPPGSRVRYTVKLGDSITTLAARHPALQDASLWKLVAQLNKLSTDTDAAGKPLVILRRGSILVLPTTQEIAEFKAISASSDQQTMIAC